VEQFDGVGNLPPNVHWEGGIHQVIPMNVANLPVSDPIFSTTKTVRMGRHAFPGGHQGCYLFTRVVISQILSLNFIIVTLRLMNTRIVPRILSNGPSEELQISPTVIIVFHLGRTPQMGCSK